MEPQNIFRKHVFVCTSGKTCQSQGGEEICSVMRERIKELGLKGQIRINKAGCLDQCGNGPMVVVYPDGVWYSHVQPSDCDEIIQQHLLEGKPVERLLYDGRGKII